MGGIWAAPSQMLNANNCPETLVCQSSLAKALPQCQGGDLCRDKMPALGNSRYWSTLRTHGSFDDWWRKSCAGGRVSGETELLHAGSHFRILDYLQKQCLLFLTGCSN